MEGQEAREEDSKRPPWSRLVIRKEQREYNLAVGRRVVALMQEIITETSAKDLASETRASLKSGEAYVAVVFDIECKESLCGMVSVWQNPRDPEVWCASLSEDLRENPRSDSKLDFRFPNFLGRKRVDLKPCLVAFDWPRNTVCKWKTDKLAKALVRSIHLHCLQSDFEVQARFHVVMQRSKSQIVRHVGKTKMISLCEEPAWAIAFADSLMDGSLVASTFKEGMTGEKCLIMRERARLAHIRVSKCAKRINGYSGDNKTERENELLQRMLGVTKAHHQSLCCLAEDSAFYLNEIEPCRRNYADQARRSPAVQADQPDLNPQ